MKVNDRVNHNDLDRVYDPDQYIKSFAKSKRSFDENKVLFV